MTGSKISPSCGRVATVLTLALAVACPNGQAAEKGGRLPAWSKVQKTVSEYFASLPDYRPGSLIVRSEVDRLLGRLKQIGWTVPNRSELLQRVCEDSGFLAQELRTSTGRQFMQRIASCSGGYDCLDRMGEMPHGRQTVHDLIYKAGGEKMIEYLTSSPGGRNLEKMLARTPRGADFGAPTGRIYTVDALLEELQKSYASTKRTL